MKQMIECGNKPELITIPRAEYESLKALKEHTAELEQQVRWLMERLQLSKHQRFGASSEQSKYDEITSGGQLSLSGEAEVCADPEAAEPELTEVETHYRKKSRGNEDRLPPDLPVEVVEHKLPEDQQNCPACGAPMHVIGKEVSRHLKLIPARAVIVEDVRYVYGCRNCEQHACEVPIVKASVPEPVIRGSFASPEAVAHIMTQKFVACVPLYRQEKEFEWSGILLSRQTMSNWVLRCSKDWLEPIYDELHKRL